ncbi:MAG: MarR family transcriptional regulator [Actinobacteria bacterium]|nr:MarR family transcriptional regulator [Actinomycetota bacterium]
MSTGNSWKGTMLMATAVRRKKLSAPIPHPELTKLRMTLGRLGRVLRQQTDEELSYALTSLLFTIGRSEPATASELADSEKVTPPSVSRSLNRLEALGLIDRAPDAHDGRVTRVRLTSKGRKEREDILRSRDIWLSEHLRQLSEQEIANLIAALPALERLCDPQLPPTS